MSDVPTIVVGIDGSGAGWRAFDWAVAEADRTGRALLVAYAGDATPTEQGARAYGRELLDDAVARLAETDSTVALDDRAARSTARDLLLDLSREADLVVVGAAAPHNLAQHVVGTTPQHILGRAHCPVVVVGEDARSDGPETVLVGVSPSEGGAAAMEFACEEARLRGTSVVAVRSSIEHEWTFEGIAAPVPHLDEWTQQERGVLDVWLDRARAQYPDVTIEGEVTGMPVYLALEKRSAEAGLLVVGCRRGEDARVLRVGPVAHWTVYHARCPVAVVGHRDPGE